MSEPAAFERILTSLYDAMLDDARWPATSALIDEACGLTGNALLVAEGPPDDIRVLFVGLYYRGQRRLDLEREYLDIYHPINEAIPRLRQLPDGQLVPIKDLYTAEERTTSRAYNEARSSTKPAAWKSPSKARALRLQRATQNEVSTKIIDRRRRPRAPDRKRPRRSSDQGGRLARSAAW